MSSRFKKNCIDVFIEREIYYLQTDLTFHYCSKNLTWTEVNYYNCKWYKLLCLGNSNIFWSLQVYKYCKMPMKVLEMSWCLYKGILFITVFFREDIPSITWSHSVLRKRATKGHNCLSIFITDVLWNYRIPAWKGTSRIIWSKLFLAKTLSRQDG